MQRVLGDVRLQSHLPEALAMSLGFCAWHTHRLAITPGACESLKPLVASAATRLADILSRVDLTDEFLQDILFSACSRCPICTFTKQLEGRLIARSAHALATKKRSIRDVMLGELCFEHSRMLLVKSDITERRRALRTLRLKQKQLLAIFGAQSNRLSNSASMPFDASMLNKLIFPGAHTLFDTNDAGVTPKCKVCNDILKAHGTWRSVALENCRLGMPSWITLPTCATHATEFIHGAYGKIGWTAFSHYLEQAIPNKAAPASIAATSTPRRTRRSSNRWFDRPNDKSGMATASSDKKTDTAQPSWTACPTCRLLNATEKRSVLRIVSQLAHLSDSPEKELLQELCLKHFAEVLIWTADANVQHFLMNELRRILRLADQRIDSPMPFGTDAQISL